MNQWEMPCDEVALMIMRHLPPGRVGTLVEVGAAGPQAMSIGHRFRADGWRVLSVEPNPEFCDEFRSRGVPILQYAASETDVGQTTFEVWKNPICSSSLKTKPRNKRCHEEAFGWTDADAKVIQVQALTLDTILLRHHPDVEHVDALVVDVEGWELEVLRGFDVNRHHPDVICIEDVFGEQEYRDHMAAIGYRMVDQLAQDCIYVPV